MKLRPLQHRLEHIYGIETCHDVDDFLLTDRRLAAHLEGSENCRSSEEKLLVREQEDGLDLSLFLDSELIDRLGRDDPTHSLHEGNLADFCTALEGVSHFVHLVWRALESRTTTQLELELQAEVDKFVACITLLERQGATAATRVLHRRIFQQVKFDDALQQVERDRYRQANHYAARYCRHLESSYLGPFHAPPREISRELRNFYRLGFRDKIAHIERARAE